jgi:hypothetical protein
MSRRPQYWIRCLLGISLFLFAATADFVSTSVITGKHHANNPVVRIEHKCAGHGGKVTDRPAKCSSAEEGVSFQQTFQLMPALPGLRTSMHEPRLSFLTLDRAATMPLRC